MRRVLPRLRARDRGAYEEIFAAYFPRLERYVGFRVRRHDASDIAQETLADLYANRASISAEPDAFENWLFMVARHRAIDLIRKLRRVEVTDDAALDVLCERRRAEAGEVERFDVAPLVRRLPEDQRRAIALRYFGDMSTAEIAAATGKSEAAVRQMESRTRRQLKRQLSGTAGVPSARS